MKIEILGVKIDKISKSEAIEKIGEFLKSGKQHLVVTPNPEFIMRAQVDEEFRKILNEASLALADGTGLILASRYLGRPLESRLTGMDMILEIFQLAEKNHYKIFLLGGFEGVAKAAAGWLKNKFPKLEIVGAESGAVVSKDQLPGLEPELKDKIIAAKPEILLVAFGAPKQEKWLAKYLKELPSVRVGIGVGGAFDFLAGRSRRAPRFLRKLGLEWLWRLILEPWRFNRIMTALVRFSWAVVKSKKNDSRRMSND